LLHGISARHDRNFKPPSFHHFRAAAHKPGPYKKLAVGSRTRTKHLGYDDKMIAEVNEAIDYADDEEG